MKRKIVSVMIWILLSMSTFLLAFNIQPVKASGTIYVRADGSVDPPTAPISSVDNITYTFSGDLFDSVVVERDDIVVDGAGYTVQGTGGGTGIGLSHRNNVTLQNVEVINFYSGIYLYYSTNNNLSGNIASNNNLGIYLKDSGNNTLIGNNAFRNNNVGIWLYDSDKNTLIANNASSNNDLGILLRSSNNNTLSGNDASNNDRGIHFVYSGDNTLIGNIASYNSNGIYLSISGNSTISGNNASHNNNYGIYIDWRSHNTVLSDNTASDNEWGIYVSSSSNVLSGNIASNNEYNFGVSGSYSSNYVDTTNTVDDKPIYYLIGVADAVYDAKIHVGTIYLINSNNITIRNLTLTKNVYGILFFNTTNSKIENVTASYNSYGIYLSSSGNSTISGNNASHNNRYGIYLSSSNNSVLHGNIASYNSYGIYLSISGNSTISGNNASHNNNYGIYLTRCNSTFLVDNDVFQNNYYGMAIWRNFNATLINNNMTGNKYNFGMFGSREWEYNARSIDLTNTVDGRPIYYLKNVNNAVYGAETNAGTFILFKCNNITVRNLTPTNNRWGVFLWNSTKIEIENVTAFNNYFGMRLWFSRNNTASGNLFSSNEQGIELIRSHDNVISGNIVSDNDRIGLHFMGQSTADQVGSTGNTILGNTIYNNTIGVRLMRSSNNVFLHNNFIENSNQHVAYFHNSTNVWDNGYPYGGNYWSNYTGVDSNHDGIGDTPHVIDENNQDNYPLMHPWGSPIGSIYSLVRDIKSFGLEERVEDRLTDLLEDAVEFLDKNREIPAMTTMLRFMHRVHKYQWFGLLTEEQADHLTTGATEIINLIWSEVKWKRPMKISP